MKTELSWTDWEKAYAAVINEGKSVGDLRGYSPAGAAEELGVSRQRIHQLVQQDRLDQLVIRDKNGTICATFVTENSVAAYQRSSRKPGRKAVG